MPSGYLYDLPLSFYVYGCTTNGAFDARKATDLGYSSVQHGVIDKFLAENKEQVKAMLAAIPQATIEEETANFAMPIAEPSIEEP